MNTINPILRIVALMLFGVLTYIDTQTFFEEEEDLLEIQEEVDREELKEKADSDWLSFKSAFAGGDQNSDFIHTTNDLAKHLNICWHQRTSYITDESQQLASLKHTPLFILNCNLKLPLA